MNSAAPDAPWVQALDTFDMDQHALAQQGWALRYEQLSPGQFKGRIQQVQLTELTLLREDTNLALRQLGRLDDSVYGFAMALQDSPDLFFNAQRVPPHAIMCGKGDEVDLRTPTQFTLLAVVVERRLLNPLWERMYHKPLAHWLEKKLVLQTTELKANALRDLQLKVLDQASALAQRGHPPLAWRQLRDDILMEWLEALPPQVDTSELPNSERRKKLVDRACELMLGHADEPLSILQVCSRLGTSRRKLNYGFQDVLGTTPVKYLRALRLNHVRRALRQAEPGTTVQDVAWQWGFWHMGQFAHDYKKLFDELPSASLRTSLRSK
ncbi:helix-turn-helix domain-containing protein [Limnohabitans sp.]|jgi:AraC family ethanolamine operon transcriptional activator|uniref:helix-turn-helix domain-containing protein n=1 Tax=Limnohabitans sp. TaxID=1907725 RepID=UPI0037BE7725